jgi:hypothetical protein
VCASCAGRGLYGCDDVVRKDLPHVGDFGRHPHQQHDGERHHAVGQRVHHGCVRDDPPASVPQRGVQLDPHDDCIAHHVLQVPGGDDDDGDDDTGADDGAGADAAISYA